MPTKGVERWMTQRLSSTWAPHRTPRRGMRQRRVPVPTPGHRGRAGRGVGIDPDEDPWFPSASVWPLLEVVDEYLDEPWLAHSPHT